LGSSLSGHDAPRKLEVVLDTVTKLKSPTKFNINRDTKFYLRQSSGLISDKLEFKLPHHEFIYAVCANITYRAVWWFELS